ncbi:hypothetical protein DBR06_SOUSAS6310019, partial [Sousa chinensis]
GREGPPACPASLGAAEPVRSRRGPRKDGKLGRLPGPAGGRVAGRPRRRSGNPPATAAGRFLEAGAPCGRRGRVSGSRGLQEARLGPGSVRSGGYGSWTAEDSVSAEKCQKASWTKEETRT